MEEKDSFKKKGNRSGNAFGNYIDEINCIPPSNDDKAEHAKFIKTNKIEKKEKQKIIQSKADAIRYANLKKAYYDNSKD